MSLLLVLPPPIYEEIYCSELQLEIAFEVTTEVRGRR